MSSFSAQQGFIAFFYLLKPVCREPEGEVGENKKKKKERKKKKKKKKKKKEKKNVNF
jgi:hypothetical protein